MMDKAALAKASRFTFYGTAGPDGAMHVGDMIEALLQSPEIDWADGGQDHWELFVLLSQMRAALDPDGDSDMQMLLEIRASGRGRRPDLAHRRERRWREIEAAIRAYRISKQQGWEPEASHTCKASDEMGVGVAAIRKARNYPEFKMWIAAIERLKEAKSLP